MGRSVGLRFVEWLSAVEEDVGNVDLQGSEELCATVLAELLRTETLP